jgi:hypothetical protein
MVSISYLNKHFNSEKIAMLKIRTLILVLSLTPLLSLNWQLPSQAQKSPSVGTAGGQSGGGTIGGSGTTNSNPSVDNTGLSPISESPKITVIPGENGSVTLSIAPATQQTLNQALATAIENLSSSNPDLLVVNLLNRDDQQAAQAVAKQIAETLIKAGVSQQSAEALTNALAELNRSGSVDINKLSIAINTINKIVKESSPETLQRLLGSPDFQETRRILIKLGESIR